MRRMMNRVRCSELGHREPELGQVQPRADQHALEVRRLPHELLVVVMRGEVHHPLNAGPVVPRAVEHDDLARRGQVRHVPLQVPLGPFPLARLGQGHHRRAARVQVLGEALDRAALARRVAALEDDHDLLPGGLHPVLQLDQLDLERALEVLVLGSRHLLRVRVVLPPGVDRPAVPEQHRVVVLVLVVDGQAGDEGGVGGPVLGQRVERGGGFAGHPHKDSTFPASGHEGAGPGEHLSSWRSRVVQVCVRGRRAPRSRSPPSSPPRCCRSRPAGSRTGPGRARPRRPASRGAAVRPGPPRGSPSRPPR